MPHSDAATAFHAVSSAHVATMNRDELTAHLTHLRILRSFADAAEITANRRAHQLATEGHAASAETAHIRTGQHSERDARAITERAAVCDHLPGFETALATGVVSTGHLDALARAIRRLDDTGRAHLTATAAHYLDQATRSSVDAFERAMRNETSAINAATAGTTAEEELAAQRRRSTIKRWTDQHTGMHHTHLELDPLRDTEMWTAINAQLATDRTIDANTNTPWSELRVQAVINAVTSTGSSNERRPEINILIDYPTLTGLATEHGLCETIDGTPLPAETVRRLCCDAHVFPTILGGHGDVLDTGRTQRTATPPQRRALAAMHRTCAHPDCTVTFDNTRIHHIAHWTQHHGPTNLDNLLPLCERHHHDVHEGGWTLTMTPDRDATWTRPDHTTHHTGTTIDRTTRATPTPRPALAP